MSFIESKEKIESLQKKVQAATEFLQLDQLEKQSNKLEQLTLREDFWDHPEQAQRLTRQLAQQQKTISRWRSLQAEVRNFDELLEMSREDEEILAELDQSLEQAEQKFTQYETDLYLSGKYDQSDVILSIHSGAGGTDASDWAEILNRMYLKFAEQQGWNVKILEKTPAEEAGIKSVTLEISGDYAYGYLKHEQGVHRLIRLSPFNSGNTRETSFAIVEVLPLLENNQEIIIKDDELRIDTFRASGAGGQHVNTTDSAVRITHLPSQIVVSCQSERSQLQNREQALKILRAKLLERLIQQEAREKQKLKGERVEAEFGSQIRSYTLHPYKLVKDHRSQHESNHPDKVLDGELLPFIQAMMKK